MAQARQFLTQRLQRCRCLANGRWSLTWKRRLGRTCCLRMSKDLTAIMNEIVGTDNVFLSVLFSFTFLVERGEEGVDCRGGEIFEHFGEA